MPALRLLAEHLGMFNDFENAVRTLQKYGLFLMQDSEGNWAVQNRRLILESN